MRQYIGPATIAVACCLPSMVHCQDAHIGDSVRPSLTGAETSELIQNVAAAELLYKNIDLVATKQVTGYGGGSWTDEQLKELGVIRNQTDRLHYIYQDEYEFYELELRRVVFGDPAEITTAARIGYDQRKTRVVDGTIVNIHEGYVAAVNRFRPHMLPFVDALGTKTPFSVLLEGKHRDGEREILVNSIQSRVVGDRRMIEIRFDFVEEASKQPLVGWTTVTVDPDRGYLPIESVGYAPDYSKEIPLEEFRVTSFQEVEPGVVFPKEAVFTIYDEGLAHRGEKKVSNERTWTFESVDLHPDYPIEKFSNIQIPQEATVYHVSDGEIVSKEGPKGTAASGQAGSSIVFWVATAILFALLAAIGGYLIYSRRVGVQDKPSMS